MFGSVRNFHYLRELGLESLILVDLLLPHRNMGISVPYLMLFNIYVKLLGRITHEFGANICHYADDTEQLFFPVGSGLGT